MQRHWKGPFRARPAAFLAVAILAAGLFRPQAEAATWGDAMAHGALVPTGFEETRTFVPDDTLALRYPRALCFDHRDDLIIADTGNNRVIIVSPDGRLLNEFGGYGWTDGRMDGPSDVRVYEGFYIYVVDEGNRRVVRYDLEGNYLDEILSEGEAGSPVSMAVSQAGGLLVVDTDSQSVLAFSQFEEATEPVGQFGLDEGGLVAPVQVSVGPQREIAVADQGRSAVLMFDEFGSPLYSLSTPDTLLPLDVAIDKGGNVIVADGRHDRLLLFPPGDRHGGSLVSLELAYRPTALALSDTGEIAVLDGESGSVHFIETAYGTDSP
jgi:DNA-binding beta-propeller fold protein YncE